MKFYYLGIKITYKSDIIMFVPSIFTSIVHCTRYLDRRRYLDEKFSILGIDSVNWCTEKNLNLLESGIRYTKEVFGLSMPIVGLDIGINARTLVKSRRLSHIEGLLLFFRFIISRKEQLIMGSLPLDKETLRIIDLEVQQMHLLALSQGVASGRKWILVMEDDCIFDNSAFSRVSQIAGLFNPDQPIWISLNSGAGLLKTKSDKLIGHDGLFRVKPPAVRCSTAYLISSTFANDFLSLVEKWGLPDWLPIDYIFHIAMRRIRNVKTFWQDPPIFLQGSEIGAYKSGLR